MFVKIPKSFAVWLLALLMAVPVFPASHREAPLISLDPAADITDFYVFRNWLNQDYVNFILNVIPGQEPSSGPNYFNFDDNVLYEIRIDNNKDNVADDIVYQIRFKTEIRPPGDQFPLSYVALPPITALDGKGSEGLILRQTYTLTEVRGGQSRILGEGLFAVPSNVGPRTMPDYDALANQGIYALGEKGSEVFVFAGQRDETFYIDLGGTFDTLNLHAPAILSMADDARNDILVNGARDSFSGFNVSSIALAVPIHQVMGPDGNLAIGAYAATSRPRMTLLGDNGRRENSTEFVQVARMGHPLINELIIPTSRKDGWNATPAQSEGQFLTYYCNSALAIALNVVFGTEFPTQNREDLVNALLRYSPGSPVCTSPSTPEEVFADLLRVDLNVPATDPENQKRLGPLAHDATGMPTPDLAGWPNGRRPNDDVTDVALRVVAGYLINPASTPLLGDGVNFNIGATGLGVTSNGIMNLFPFLPRPHNGRDRRHIDPGENP